MTQFGMHTWLHSLHPIDNYDNHYHFQNCYWVRMISCPMSLPLHAHWLIFHLQPLDRPNQQGKLGGKCEVLARLFEIAVQSEISRTKYNLKSSIIFLAWISNLLWFEKWITRFCYLIGLAWVYIIIRRVPSIVNCCWGVKLNRIIWRI